MSLISASGFYDSGSGPQGRVDAFEQFDNPIDLEYSTRIRDNKKKDERNCEHHP